jgi:Asp-tRNA(Asn)/Glu-tRNA(Gln) amidotransferase A subunit family amidase
MPRGTLTRSMNDEQPRLAELVGSLSLATDLVAGLAYEAARAEAREADRRRAAGEPLGPLHGVPITVKECLAVAGMPATFGLPARANAPAGQDDRYVARMRQAGAIVLGKTNVALAAMAAIERAVRGRGELPGIAPMA